MWRHVATDLAADHTVIAPDLRGYGNSDKPATGYAKRTMAQDVVALARALGHPRFTLVGHDRGALVAFRAGLDHPDAVAGLMCLDVLPTVDMWDVLHGVHASVAWHLYLMAQPAGLPERMIEADPDLFFGHFLDVWSTTEIPADVRREYLAACRDSIASIVADYRASAFEDIDDDTMDKQQEISWACRSRSSSTTGDSTAGTAGTPGRPSSNTTRSPTAISWPRTRQRRSARRSGNWKAGPNPPFDHPERTLKRAFMAQLAEWPEQRLHEAARTYRAIAHSRDFPVSSRCHET
ncbi:hypothetical protein GCM10029964_016860 [Kibdelosporangium lantanae]